MRKIALTAALLAATVATPAFAQDDAAPAPGGFHVSGIIGYDAPEGDVDGSSGVVYGIGAGYDFNLGSNIVAGPEVELTSSSTDECEGGINRPGDVLCLDAGRDIYVGARLGFEASPGTLIYAKGGYTNARLNVLAVNGDDELDENFQIDGWRLGAGVEKSIGRNTYAKIEYRYSNYTDADFEYANGATTDRFEVDTDRHQIVAGLGFRF